MKSSYVARAKVLTQTAGCAGCAVQLGIVHIEESGGAEGADYDYRHGGRVMRGNRSSPCTGGEVVTDVNQGNAVRHASS